MPHKENETYELIPGDGDTWNIRILEGLFAETVLNYGKIGFNEVDGHMTFDFSVVSTPDSEVNVDNLMLQETAGDILQEVISNALEKGEGIYGKHPDASDDQWEILTRNAVAPN